MTTTDTKRAEGQAKAQLEGIRELVAAVEAAVDDDAKEQARQAIQEDALSAQVRSDWHSPGEHSSGGEFNILLCTGGPAVRIIGTLGSHGEPDSATIEYQDWFTPWIELPTSSQDEETILAYAREFYFGN